MNLSSAIAFLCVTVVVISWCELPADLADLGWLAPLGFRRRIDELQRALDHLKAEHRQLQILLWNASVAVESLKSEVRTAQESISRHEQTARSSESFRGNILSELNRTQLSCARLCAAGPASISADGEAALAKKRSALVGKWLWNSTAQHPYPDYGIFLEASLEFGSDQSLKLAVLRSREKPPPRPSAGYWTIPSPEQLYLAHSGLWWRSYDRVFGAFEYRQEGDLLFLKDWLADLPNIPDIAGRIKGSQESMVVLHRIQ